VSATETERRGKHGHPRMSWAYGVLMRPRTCDAGPAATVQDEHRAAVQCGRGRRSWIGPTRVVARPFGPKTEKEGGLLFSFFSKQILNWILNPLLNLNQPLNTKKSNATA
jgi:hypothetical protein